MERIVTAIQGNKRRGIARCYINNYIIYSKMLAKSKQNACNVQFSSLFQVTRRMGDHPGPFKHRFRPAGLSLETEAQPLEYFQGKVGLNPGSIILLPLKSALLHPQNNKQHTCLSLFNLPRRKTSIRRAVFSNNGLPCCYMVHCFQIAGMASSNPTLDFLKSI